MIVETKKNTEQSMGALRRDYPKQELLAHFERIEKEANVVQKGEFNSLVNFSTRRSYPIHRWFYYHEAYSPELVTNLIRSSRGRRDFSVIDPFNGGGTTSLVSAFEGIQSVGLEVNPFSYFLSKIKCRRYSHRELKKLKNYLEFLRTNKFRNKKFQAPTLSIIDKLFDPPVLNELLNFKSAIFSIDDLLARDFFNLGWLCVLEKVSNYRKGGNGLKKRPRPPEDKVVKEQLMRQWDLMIGDIEYLLLNGSYEKFIEPKIHLMDSVNEFPDFDRNKFGLSIFSPPYMNCFDYFEIYKIELWMGDFVDSYGHLRTLRKTSLRSHLNANFSGNGDHREADLIRPLLQYLSTQKLWDKRIPSMISGYFSDMGRIIKRLSTVLEKGASCVIVVGNSAYSNIVVPVDAILAVLANRSGFECIQVGVARKNETSSQQHLRLGSFDKFLRESLVFLKKK